MGKIALFNSSWLTRYDTAEDTDRVPRISIAALAGYLKANSIEVKIIDEDNLEAIKRQLKSFCPDFIGVPAFTGEVHDAATISQVAKELFPYVTTIVGGPHPSAIPKETLEEFPSFDIAITGEGEIPLNEIIGREKPLSQVLGIAYRNNGKIIVNDSSKTLPALDDLPYPAWDLFDLEKYRKRGVLSLSVETGRACPYGCIFCYRVSGTTVRYKSPQKVIKEIDYNINTFRIQSIILFEGVMTTHRKKAVELLVEIKKSGIYRRVKFHTDTRANIVNHDLLTLMKDIGITATGIGIESADPTILKNMGKGFTVETIEKAINLSYELGIEMGGSCIFGHPFETVDSIKKTINFIKNSKLTCVTFAIMVPFPGTRLREMAEKGIGGLKILSNDWRLYGKQAGEVLDLEQISKNELKRLQAEAYKAFYMSSFRRFFYFVRNYLNINRIKFILKRLGP